MIREKLAKVIEKKTVDQLKEIIKKNGIVVEKPVAGKGLVYIINRFDFGFDFGFDLDSILTFIFIFIYIHLFYIYFYICIKTIFYLGKSKALKKADYQSSIIHADPLYKIGSLVQRAIRKHLKVVRNHVTHYTNYQSHHPLHYIITHHQLPITPYFTSTSVDYFKADFIL